MKIPHIIRIFLIFILLSSGMACNENSSNRSEEDTAEVNRNDSLLQEKFNYPKIEIDLSEAARNEAEEWMLYVAIESEIKRMKNYNLDDVVSNAPSILRASDTLLKTIPKKYRTKPIESRMKVLHTKASVLNQLSKQQQKDLEKLKEVAEEVPVDFFNLNIQLNEIYIEMPDLETLEK